MSLRRRLLLGLLAMGAVLVVTNLVLSSTFESFLLDRVDRQLVDVASRPVFRGGRPAGFGAPEDQTLSEYFIAVGDPNTGTLVQLGSAFADQDQPPPRLERSQILGHLADRHASRPFTAPAQSGEGSWRVVAVEDGFGRRVTVVGISLDEVRATIARIRLVQVTGTLAVLGALGLVSWWMLRLGVHPIENMARTADAIAAGDLSQRVEHPGPRTEAGRLGSALNTMLGRIEEAFRAREASEARVRRFAADASHELRTPLTSIQGYAELWRAGGLRSKAELADAMRRIEQEASRMGALVEDLLLLARLDQRRPLQRAAVRLDQIVDDAIRDARAVEPDRPIDCSLEPAVVEGDEGGLRQVVANLLTNGRVHTPAGTPIHVSVVQDDGRVRLEVVDEGPGMEPAVAEKVFERFFRADPARGRHSTGTARSSGLGLAIVEAVAVAHGGQARVESKVGQGSRFIVELPVDGGSSQDGAVSGSAPAVPSFARPRPPSTP